VRDRLLGRPLEEEADLDLVVEGDAVAFGRALEDRWGGQLHIHHPFLTASWDGAELARPVDLVTARRETYQRPGALPDVVAGSLSDDLARRDFTVNAMAERIWPDPMWDRVDSQGGERDLQEGVLRILHPRSFDDDPTRILRLARFAVRLDMRPHAVTQAALDEIVSSGFEALTSVGGDRLRGEWCRVCSEPDPVGVMRWLSRNKVSEALGFSAAPAAMDALDRLFTCRSMGRRVSAEDFLRCWWLAGAVASSPGSPERSLQAFGLENHYGPWLRQKEALSEAAEGLEGVAGDDELEAYLADFDESSLSMLLALYPESRTAVGRYESVIRPTPPLLDGRQLLAAGMAEGPGVGHALKRVRVAQLRGDLSSSEEALAFLELPLS